MENYQAGLQKEGLQFKMLWWL